MCKGVIFVEISVDRCMGCGFGVVFIVNGVDFGRMRLMEIRRLLFDLTFLS